MLYTLYGSKLNFDRFLTAIFKTLSRAHVTTRISVSELTSSDPPLLEEFELLTLGLITYHPEGKQVNVRKVEENSKKLDKGIQIELKDKDWIKKFETLHGKHSKVFSDWVYLSTMSVNSNWLKIPQNFSIDPP